MPRQLYSKASPFSRDCLRQFADGSVVLLELHVCYAPILVIKRYVRLEPNGFGILANGLIPLIQIKVSFAPEVVCDIIIRFEPIGFGIVVNCTVIILFSASSWA
jgi:hypothetical protein